MKRWFPNLAELDAGKLMVAPFAFAAFCFIAAAPFTIFVRGLTD